ncbi:MAG: thiamine pyrophosphate-dependent enzyme, partial [Rhodothermales bacterium]|nr:thiamine pyrophosphate-dependent enzyme [Rhodothermales bacterium]
MSSRSARIEDGFPGQNVDFRIAREILRIRLSQLIVNERYKRGDFRVPIHLAMGHEAIAVAVSEAMEDGDELVLPHRNLHYNLARGASVRQVVDEFLLRPEGLAGGGLGSMNLVNQRAGIVYTSSILGNNLSVATGVAFARKVEGGIGVTIVVLGDGAIEEGSFYETLLMMASFHLPVLVVVEDNEWSLATRTEERRGAIALSSLVEGVGGQHTKLSGNDPYEYSVRLPEIRRQTLAASK